MKQGPTVPPAVRRGPVESRWGSGGPVRSHRDPECSRGCREVPSGDMLGAASVVTSFFGRKATCQKKGLERSSVLLGVLVCMGAALGKRYIEVYPVAAAAVGRFWLRGVNPPQRRPIWEGVTPRRRRRSANPNRDF